MKKRALSLLMAVIMVVSLLPTAVWAAETDISALPEFTATSDTSRTDFKFFGRAGIGCCCKFR